eukprot:jgi/Ulvmu1/4100/UM019_0079.1
MQQEYVDMDPDPSEVQWYYSAASTASQCVSDVPGKADFVKFCDGDSLLLESIYRKDPTRYEKEWWQQHDAVMANLPHKAAAVPAPAETQADLEPCGPVVRSGYYEADLANRRVYPIYWPEAPRMLMRGTWFVQAPGQQNTLIPLPHCIACKLEDAWQHKKFDSTQMTSDHRPQADGMYGTRIELGGMLESSYYAVFTDRNNMFMCAKDSQSVLKNLIPFKATGARLLRGYDPLVERDPNAKKEQTEQADLSSFEARTVGMAVRHVVLAVHGIGQRMGGRTIADDAQAVRRRVNAMLDDYMPDEIGRGYIQVLPIQWRKNLDLEADQVADSIMPEGARSFRQLAHNTCVEVLMYMSPSHAQNILDSVATNLNCTYLRFVRRHAEFSGRISILAYSLGGVLCYDLLAHQPVPHESAPAQAFRHIASLHEQAQEARERQWLAGSADAELAGEAEGQPARRSTDTSESPSPRRSHWLSYWGLFKKSVNVNSPGGSRVRREEAALAREKSSDCAASDDDPVIQILDDAAAHMRADAAMWQSRAKGDDAESVDSDASRGQRSGGGQAGDGRRGDGRDGARGQGGFPPQRWLGRLARKIGQVRGRGRPELPVHKEEGSGQHDVGADEAPEEPREADAAEGRSGVMDDAAVDQQDSLADSAGRATSAASPAAPGPDSGSPRWRSGPTGSTAEDGGGPDGRSVFDAGGPGSAHNDAVRSSTSSRHSTEGREAPGEGAPAAGGAVVPLASILGSRPLSEAAVAASPGGRDELQEQLELLRTEAAATAARIAEVQAQLRQLPAGSPFGDAGGGPESAANGLPPVQRSTLRQCLPAEAPHSMLPEHSVGLPTETAEHHTYGMGDVQEAPAAVSPLLDKPQQESEAGRADERIAQTRVLWPGSALHELDTKQQQPLTMQALHYPGATGRDRAAATCIQELSFLVDNFIMIGSPAGLFAALRGVNPSKGRPLGSPAAGMLYPSSAPGGLPVCRRMYNVFHPFDPVAYRLEPLIQRADCPRPQLVPYHRGGRKLKMNIVDAGENVAKTMDKVAAAFTFSFRRSKEEALAPAVAHVDYQQCSVAPYLLGLPLLLPAPQEGLHRVSSRATVALGPAGRSGMAGSVSARSAPEAWRSADSPRTLPLQSRLSSSSETLARMIPDLVDDGDTGSILSCPVDVPAAAPDSPIAHTLRHSHSATWQGSLSGGGRVSLAVGAPHALRHKTSAARPVPRLEASSCSAVLMRPGPPSESGSTRAFRNAADAAPRRSRRVLAGAGQGGLCPQGQGGSVGRLDFQLQEDFVETQFFGAFRAHFCYWKHEDVALLVCRAACGYDVVDGTQEAPAAPA